MGFLTPRFVPGGGFLYTMIVPGGGFLPPSSRVPGVCPGGGMVLDEIDNCIMTQLKAELEFVLRLVDRHCQGEVIQMMQQNKGNPINCDMEANGDIGYVVDVAHAADVTYVGNVTYKKL